jgi:hypothetical protein
VEKDIEGSGICPRAFKTPFLLFTLANHGALTSAPLCWGLSTWGYAVEKATGGEWNGTLAIPSEFLAVLRLWVN